MADLKISVDIDASGTAAGAAQAKAAIKGIGDEAERTQRRASSILDIDFRAAAAKLQSVGEMVGNAGQRMQQAGQSMSVAVTAPLAALATLGIKAALELDAARTKIAALTGSAEAANAKIIELRQLAATSVGVTQRAALDTYAQLKGIGGILGGIFGGGNVAVGSGGLPTGYIAFPVGIVIRSVSGDEDQFSNVSCFGINLTEHGQGGAIIKSGDPSTIQAHGGYRAVFGTNPDNESDTAHGNKGYPGGTVLSFLCDGVTSESVQCKADIFGYLVAA